MEIEFGRRHNNNTNSHLIRRSHRPLVVCTTTYQHLTHRRRDPRKKRKKKKQKIKSLSLLDFWFLVFLFLASPSLSYTRFSSAVVWSMLSDRPNPKPKRQGQGQGQGQTATKSAKKQQKEKGRLGFFFHEPSGTTLGLEEGRGASDQCIKKSSSTC